MAKAMAMIFTNSEIDQAVDCILQQKTVTPDELRKLALGYFAREGVRDKRFWQFAKIAEHNSELKKYLIQGIFATTSGVRYFFRKYPNYYFSPGEMEKLVISARWYETTDLILTGRFTPKQVYKLKKIAIENNHEKVVADFFERAPYTQDDVDKLFSIVEKANDYVRPSRSQLFLSLFPNDNRREKLFGWLSKKSTCLMKFAKDHELSENEKKLVVEILSKESGYKIIKYQEVLPRLFNSNEELQDFLLQNRRKIIDWALNKGLADLVKQLPEITQEDINYIVGRVTGTKAWEPECVKEILEAVDRGKIHIKEEDYGLLSSALVIKILTN